MVCEYLPVNENKSDMELAAEVITAAGAIDEVKVVGAKRLQKKGNSAHPPLFKIAVRSLDEKK